MDIDYMSKLVKQILDGRAMSAMSAHVRYKMKGYGEIKPILHAQKPQPIFFQPQFLKTQIVEKEGVSSKRAPPGASPTPPGGPCYLMAVR